MKNKGFTLIELMIVVGIISLLAAIAIPNISKYLRESKRTDAVVALNTVQQAQAKLRANCRWYGELLVASSDPANCAADAAESSAVYPGAVSGVGLSENKYYDIAITAGSASGTAYTATATARTGGPQKSDADCQVFVLTVNAANPNGLKTSINSSSVESTATTDTCWK